MHLPADQRHGSSIHRTALGCENSLVGQRNLRHAEHNAIVFSRFITELEALLGQGRAQRRGKKRGKKIFLRDAAEASRYGNYSGGSVGDKNGDGYTEEVEWLKKEQE